MKRLRFTASAIHVAALESSDIFMTVTLRMASTRKNLNDVVVSEKFIDEIVSNPEKYMCLSQYADVDALRHQDFDRLGHMFDEETEEFGTEQIGAFYAFEKRSDEFGTSLIGSARVPKRDKRMCQAIRRLYEQGLLFFSFEVEAGTYTVEDGVTFIDADERNRLCGMCVVSTPAYPEAVAMDFVAQKQEHASDEQTDECTDHVAEAIQSNLQSMRPDEQHDWRVERMEDGYAICYDRTFKKTYKVEFEWEEKSVRLSDPYEIEYRRQGGLDKMDDMERKNPEEKEQVLCEEKPVENTEEKKEDEMIAKKDEKNVCSEAEIEAMRNQIAELAGYKEKWEAAEAARVAAEQLTQKAEMKAFAQKSGLDTANADVSKAIDDMDYASLMRQASQKEESSDKGAWSLSSTSDDFCVDQYKDLFVIEKR